MNRLDDKRLVQIISSFSVNVFGKTNGILFNNFAENATQNKKLEKMNGSRKYKK